MGHLAVASNMRLKLAGRALSIRVHPLRGAARAARSLSAIRYAHFPRKSCPFLHTVLLLISYSSLRGADGGFEDVR
jgi:hypothetical protein